MRYPELLSRLLLVDADSVRPAGKALCAAGVSAFAAVVFLLDHITAPYFSFTPLYLLPIAAAAWIWGWRAASITAVAATLAHSGSHAWSTPVRTDWLMLAWDGAVLLAMFLLFVWFVVWLHWATVRALREAWIDTLTGVCRRETFLERGGRELARAARYVRPLTVAYVDIDRFKEVNDRYGHEAGDRVLATVGGLVQTSVRTFDVAGRMGGDEFALLLPETDAFEAGVLLQRLRAKLAGVVAPDGSPLAFSIGAVTVTDGIESSIEALIARADALMYAVKRAGGNALQQETVGPGSAPNAP